MEIKNIEDAQNIIDGFEALRELAQPIAEEIAKLENKPGQIDDEEITIEDGVLYANWETYCCGGSDYHSVRIPLEYLFDDDWLKEAQSERLRKNLEAVKKKQEEDAKKERLAKARRYEEYLDLRKEFDENG